MKKLNEKISKLIKSLLVILIVSSQFFLPIEALAEELNNQLDTPLDEEQDIFLDDQTEIPNYKIFINELEHNEDNFNIEEDMAKQIKIMQNYTGEDNYTYTPSQSIEIDFTNRLYGKYTYELSVSNELELLESKNITINYLGDNNQIININNIYFHNNTYYILGNTTLNLTVQDIISQFNNDLSLYNATLELYDTENNLLLSTDYVEDNYKLKLKATYEDNTIFKEITEEYTINIVEDINEDEIIDNKDIQKLIIEEILNQENIEVESNLNVIDVTNIVVDNIIDEPVDSLTTTFEHNGNIFLDQELVLNYYVDGFEYDVLKGIEGNIKYDKNILELTSIEINSSLGGYNEDGHFIYLLNDYNKNGLLMTFKFKPLAVGSTSITIDNLVGATGSLKGANLDTNSYEGQVNVLEYGIGGDVDNEDTEEDKEIIESDNSHEEEKDNNATTETLIVTPSINTTTTYVKPVLLSGDNYIKTLKIKNYEINFDKNILEYQLNVKNNIKKLDLDIELNDSNAQYEVLGNESFKDGENTVKIIVTAENGNEKTYTINVNKEASEVIEEENIEEENENSNSSKAVIIFLIILVIIGLVYVIFKDDDEDEK